MLDIACIDLFCGAGGLTSGLDAENISVVAGIDVDENCRHPFKANNGGRFLNRDVGSLSTPEIDDLFGDAKVRVLAGCASCQPFSTYSQRYETVGTPQWSLLYRFSQLAKAGLPEIITMENVSLTSLETSHIYPRHVLHLICLS